MRSKDAQWIAVKNNKERKKKRKKRRKKKKKEKKGVKKEEKKNQQRKVFDLISTCKKSEAQENPRRETLGMRCLKSNCCL